MMNEEKIKRKPFLDSGILLVDKPKEWTSHDVVNFIRLRSKAKKVGHCGTLDPAATGLLVIVINRATKLSQQLSGQDKVYKTTMLLGTETDSLDMDGNIIQENDNWKELSETQVIEVVESFKGKQLQTPPMVSAKKIDGKKLYELARKGQTVERAPVPIEIHSIDIHEINIPEVNFTVSCSKGTYIRSLCSDMGKKLKCGAVLKDLRRLKSGIFSIDNSFTIDEIREWDQETLADNLLWLHNLQL